MENNLEIGVKLEALAGKNLWSALAKAQGEIEDAEQSGENSFYKDGSGKPMRYATIGDTIKAIQKAASNNGLSIFFEYKTEIISENPVGWIRYILTHSSGELYQSEWLIMFMKDKTPQGFGASNTYYRRQLLKSVFQIADLDDDGNSQSQNDTTWNQNRNQPSQNKAPIRVPVTK